MTNRLASRAHVARHLGVIVMVSLLGLLGLSACRARPAPCSPAQSPVLRIAVADPRQRRVALHPMFNTLLFTQMPVIGLDAYGRLTPGMVRTWQTPDRQTWTFTLYESLHTHDGQRVTAARVRSGILTLIGRLEADDPKSIWRDLLAIETPTPLTLVFRFRRPASVFPEALQSLVQRSARETRDFAAGPWRLTNEAADRLDFVAFPPVAGDAGPRGLRVDIYPSTRAAWAAFLRNETDVLYEVPNPFLSLVAQHPDIQLYGARLDRIQVLVFNLRHPWLRDVRIRQAMNLALDREAILRAIYGGYEPLLRGIKPVVGPFSPNYWATTGIVSPWHYDLARARALINAARGDRQEPIEITAIVAGDFLPNTEVVPMLESQLARVGIRLRLDSVSLEELTARIQRGSFDAALLPTNTGRDGFFTYLVWRSGGRAAGLYRESTYRGADAALDHLYAAPSPDAERAAVREVVDAMAADPPAAFIVPVPTVRAVRRTWHVPDDELDIRDSLPRWRFDGPCGGA